LWVIWVVTFAVLLPGDLVWSLSVVAFEKSSHYVEATVATVIAVVVLSFVGHWKTRTPGLVQPVFEGWVSTQLGSP